MKLRIALAAMSVAALAGCGGGGGDKADGNQQRAAVDGTGGISGEAIQVRPGQWEMRTEVKAVSGPGVPAGAVEAMKAQKTTVTTCITEEQAKTSDPKMFTGKQNPNCKAEGFKASGGKIDGTLTCKGENGQPGVTMTMAGTFEAERYDLQMKMKMGGPEQGMTIETATSGRRIGECPAGAKS
ncbi:DUF3617 domain-containing protein [Sphingosinicella sp. BN140058]|uniref:DUF3617 domain-containing protein n=1 Tax=Sphingosinicella sp. BN140058 TaxID=1892855 RepID=UPI001012C7A0|nr:DUF3617 domain-containing protein [Sphingosinicella sp. BN140058]QAY76174.1 DUF3617 domain-containing protein [Sphingosinicella sp. BN140058]